MTFAEWLPVAALAGNGIVLLVGGTRLYYKLESKIDEHLAVEEVKEGNLDLRLARIEDEVKDIHSRITNGNYVRHADCLVRCQRTKGEAQ